MKLTVASSPHIRGNFRTSRIMLDVVLALLPALGVGVWVLGFRALLVALVCVASAVAAEFLYGLVTRGRNTIIDCSAMVTGLLLAMTLPHTVPLWLAAVGSVFAIVLTKALCGGLGQNIFNPALAARAFLMLVFPLTLTRYEVVDAVSSATPMHHMAMHVLPDESLLDVFLGNCSGSIGELSALALLLGGAYLVIRKVISIRIPAAYLGVVAILTLIFCRAEISWEQALANALQGNFGLIFVNALMHVRWMLYQVMGGGLMLGAIFMATDYATSPATPMGQWIFGAGCGVLTVIFRYFGIFPEGVTYAILLMNALVWFIDRITAPRRFGTKKGGAQA